MTNQELKVLWSLVSTVNMDRKYFDKMSQDDLAKWVSRQLYESLAIYTAPVGATYLYHRNDRYGKEAYEDWQNE